MLISPEQVPIWVPGRLTLSSPGGGWSGVAVRGYAYPASAVDVPAVRDHVIVAYRRGITSMRRRASGPWHDVELRPGDVSLLNSGEPTRWEWSSDIEVVHVYVDASRLESTCRDMFDREVSELELDDALKADDPHLYNASMMLAGEANRSRPGHTLLADALALQLRVLLLRNHANMVFKESPHRGGLTLRQQQHALDYIRDNLDRNLSLDNLARSAGLSTYHFARQFRVTFHVSPHQFVMEQRLERAQEMLRRTTSSLTDIAAECGFADASHLIRVFKKHCQMTPGQFRSGV